MTCTTRALGDREDDRFRQRASRRQGEPTPNRTAQPVVATGGAAKGKTTRKWLIVQRDVRPKHRAIGLLGARDLDSSPVLRRIRDRTQHFLRGATKNGARSRSRAPSRPMARCGDARLLDD